MVRLLLTLELGACLVLPVRAEGAGARWPRRLTLLAACATSVWDVATTRTAVRYGAMEGNSFLAGSQSTPRWGRMLGLKIGLCAGSALAQELPRHRNRRFNAFWTGVNSGLAVRFTAASLQNRRVKDELVKAGRSPGTAANAHAGLSFSTSRTRGPGAGEGVRPTRAAAN